MQTNQKIGTWKRGTTLVKSSWHIFKAEKKLLIIQVLAAVAMLLAVVALLAIFVATGSLESVVRSGTNPTASVSGLAVILIGYLIFGVINSYFSGMFVHMVYKRLSGQPTNLRSTITATNECFPQLAAFGMMNGIVGAVIEYAQNRLPFAGKLLAFLGSIAWTVATIFAIPVIVTSKEKVGPIKAIKESASLIRKTWGEGVISQLGIGLVAMLSVIAFTLAVTAIGTLTFTLQLSVVTNALIVLGVLGILGISFVFSMLSSIAQAALFYYAQTGKEPEQFDKELLQTVMTPKKARKIFA